MTTNNSVECVLVTVSTTGRDYGLEYCGPKCYMVPRELFYTSPLTNELRVLCKRDLTCEGFSYQGDKVEGKQSLLEAQFREWAPYKAEKVMPCLVVARHALNYVAPDGWYFSWASSDLTFSVEDDWVFFQKLVTSKGDSSAMFDKQMFFDARLKVLGYTDRPSLSTADAWDVRNYMLNKKDPLPITAEDFFVAIFK